MKCRVVLLGAGNVARSFGAALKGSGFGITQVYSRTHAAAQELGSELGAPFCSALEEVVPGADLYLIMVKDDAIAEVASALPCPDGLVAHTAGSVPLSVLSRFPRSGVMYPLQTFSKAQVVDFRRVPCFVEGSSPEVLSQLQAYAYKMSPIVYEADSEKRQWLHLSAVWGCNFVNHLWGIASDILKQEGLPLQVLQPLMEVALKKALSTDNPHRVQTGPAVRGDVQVMEKHVAMLADKPELQQMYRLFSELIKKSAYDV